MSCDWCGIGVGHRCGPSSPYVHTLSLSEADRQKTLAEWMRGALERPTVEQRIAEAVARERDAIVAHLYRNGYKESAIRIARLMHHPEVSVDDAADWENSG